MLNVSGSQCFWVKVPVRVVNVLHVLLTVQFICVTASACPQGDLGQLGRVVLQGGFSVWISHKRAAVRMKELARFKPMQRHLFLYDHALLFCKRRDEDPHDRAPFYSFKSCLRVTIYNTTLQQILPL